MCYLARFHGVSGSNSGVLLQVEEVAQIAEILLHEQADTLGVERVAGEVSVVGLVVYLDGEVSVWQKQVANVEVADERTGGIRVVAIAELAIDEQPVVEQSTAQKSFIFSVVEALVAS